MALGLLSNEILNTLWEKAYGERHGVYPFFQFVTSLAPRRDETRSLKGEFLAASEKGLALRNGLGSFGRYEIAVLIDEEIGIADILLALPVPLDCEALEFAGFLAKSHADFSVDIPADTRRRGADALPDSSKPSCARLVLRGASVTRPAQTVAFTSAHGSGLPSNMMAAQVRHAN